MKRLIEQDYLQTNQGLDDSMSSVSLTQDHSQEPINGNNTETLKSKTKPFLEPRTAKEKEVCI